MPFSMVKEVGRRILKLEGSITVRDAQELAARLAHDTEDVAPCGVDTDALTDIDTCILQLLYSWRKSVPALRFDNPSQVFIGAVDRCALRRELLSAQEGL